MSEYKLDSYVRLGYENWQCWELYVQSAVLRKNAIIMFDPMPVDPQTQQQVIIPATVAGTTTTPSVMVNTQPTAEELKTYRDGLEKWRSANNIAKGVILGSVSNEVRHVVTLGDSAKEMYNKLRAEVIKQSSGSSAFGTQVELIRKVFKDVLTLENFEQHLSFYCTKNATLIAAGSGLTNSFLAFLLLYSFSSLEDPVWSLTCLNISTSDIPIGQWSFNQVAGKLREALRSMNRSAETSTPATSQSALNAATSKAKPGRYNRPPCTYPNCLKPKTHPIEKCWAKEREEKEKEGAKKHRAKKAKKKATIESNSDSGSGLDSSDSGTGKKRHHANHLQAKTLRVLKATIGRVRSYKGCAAENTLFVAHPDSGASNHMTHRLELFDSSSFKMLKKPIPVSLGDDSEVFATGKGMIRVVFKVDGKNKEGKFDDVLYVPDLKVMLLSVGQSARLPHCKITFDDNICEYIDKNSGEVIARVYALGESDLYTLDTIPLAHKVDAKLASSSSININVLHRRLGHLRLDNCHLMVNCRLVDGVDKITGKEEFCEGCAYGRSKRKPHPPTGTRTRRRLERIHVDICGPLPSSIGGNHYFLLIVDEHTRYMWTEFMPKKSDAFARLRRWKLRAERETDLKLRHLKSDGGMEFSSKAFEEWLAVDGMTHERSALYEHEQNGLAERGIQTISQ